MGDKLLYLHSDKSTNNKFTLDKRISGIYKLVSFVSTNNIYNINQFNNKIYWNENGTDRTTTLTEGYYNSSDFTTHLSTQLNSDASGTITVTFNNNTRKFTITDTVNFHFTFGTNTSNNGRKLLGFNASDGTAATSQVSTNSIDLNTCKNIFITISQDDERKIEGIDFFNASLVINGTADFGETLRYIDDDNFHQQVKFKKTKTLELQIHDSNNNNIDLNSEYQIILQKI